MKKANQVIGKEKFKCVDCGLVRKRGKTKECEYGASCTSPEEYEASKKARNERLERLEREKYESEERPSENHSSYDVEISENKMNCERSSKTDISSNGSTSRSDDLKKSLQTDISDKENREQEKHENVKKDDSENDKDDEEHELLHVHKNDRHEYEL